MRFVGVSFVLGLCVLFGCNRQADDAPVAEDITEPTTTAATPQADLASQPALPTEPSVDYGEWLPLPSDASQRMAENYPDIVQEAMRGDNMAQVNLAAISQQMAVELGRRGNEAMANRFFIQSAKALRLALKGGAEGVPDGVIGQIYFDEARALATENKSEPAMLALEEAVTYGFSDMERLASDKSLATVREMDGFEAKLEQWRELAAEKLREHAREELANGETFDFDLTATSLSGEPVSLAELKGKVVIVDVWGTWCPPCRAEIPSFVKLQEQYGEEGFQMIGLNYEREGSEAENRKAVENFIEEFGINYPCILGDDETKDQIPEFRGFPTTLFIDKTGTVRMKVVGLHEYGYLEAVVQELMNES